MDNAKLNEMIESTTAYLNKIADKNAEFKYPSKQYAKRFVIVCKAVGDATYVTRVGDESSNLFNVSSGDPETAIVYTRADAKRQVAALVEAGNHPEHTFTVVEFSQAVGDMLNEYTQSAKNFGASMRDALNVTK